MNKREVIILLDSLNDNINTAITTLEQVKRTLNCDIDFEKISQNIDFMGNNIWTRILEDLQSLRKSVNDKELRNSIECEWKQVLDAGLPDEWLNEIENMVKDDSDYPEYSIDDVVIAVRNFLKIKLNL